MKTAARPPLRRLLGLDRLIRAGRYPNSSSVAAELEVYPRTVLRDLEFLRDSLGAPLAFCRKRNGYFCTTPGYSLPVVRLTEGELLGLFLAEGVLRQSRGTSFEADLRRVVGKLSDGLAGELSADPTALSAVCVLPTSVTPQDAAVFAALSAACSAGEGVELDYRGADSGALTTRRVDAYSLALRGSDWYLIGHCHLRGEVRMFTPQGVQAVRPTGERFSRPADFDAEAYLAGAFGSVCGDGRHEVGLLFAAGAAVRAAERV